ncbi:hypothetical protein [Flavitalea sp.]|nr:hypothetical protein [Flavitalea sp.]
MAKIIMQGWQEGMKKVSLTELQNTLLQIPLNESKDNVDKLLSSHIVEIEISDRFKAGSGERK